MSGGRAVHYFVGPLRVTAFAFDDAVRAILAARDEAKRLSFHFCTAHSVAEASKSVALRTAFNADDSVNTTDGMPLVWVGRLKKHRVERVYGPDVMLAVLDRGREKGYRHYFYGGAPDIAELLATRMRARFPGLNVVGVESPPFRSLSAEESAEVVARINAASPDCVWVGLGAPKQEIWVHEYRRALHAAALLAVGAAFDFNSGVRRQAPGWMQRAGLEWFFRLMSEPRRLWRRYTLTNLTFLSVLLAEMWRDAANKLRARSSVRRGR